MSGSLEKACLAIVKSARDKPSYYAEALYDAMKGIGTNDDELIRILVTRSEVSISMETFFMSLNKINDYFFKSDLKEIKESYKKLYNKDL